MSNNVRNVTKQLLGAEDVAFGRGVVQQNRGGALVPIHKLDLDLPVADESELATTDTAKYPKASIGSRLFVAVNGQYQELSHIVPVIYRVGGALSAEYPYCENGNVIAKWNGEFPKTLTSEDADFSPAGWQIYTVGSGRTIVSETQPPVSYGEQGMRWYNPSLPATFIYYVDGDSGQWVEEAHEGIDGGLRADLGVDPSALGASLLNPELFGAVGDGVADDTSALQSFINYCRDNGLYGEASPKAVGYRFTSQLKTQKDVSFKRVNIDFKDIPLIADFSGAAAILVEGGVNFQNLYGLNLKPSLSQQYSGTYEAASIGLHIKNARHNVEGRITYFKGENALIESTAGQTNGSYHKLDCQAGGRGILITGASDDVSVIHSYLRAFGNGKEGIRVETNSAMRQWTCFWNCEGNWLEAPISTNYGVYVGKCIDSDLWIYSEQGNSASEIFFDSTLCTNNKVFSARRNKDFIGGSNQAWNGRDVYQNATGTRSAEPFRVVGKLARTTAAGEYVRVPFVGFNETLMGYVYAEQKQIGAMSTTNIFVGASDTKGLVNKSDFFGVDFALTTAAPSQTYILGTLTAGTMLTGSVYFAGRASSGGTGAKHKKFDFYCNGLTLTQVAATIDQEPGTLPPTLTLSVNGSNQLQLVLSYNSGQWGASYTGKASIQLSSVGSFL